ncbi:hypothetical protein [Rubritalea marina]|uniref:hypothetical protein n=1 Tax=Rubritalea marina TaxID=361055 RepID=UPI00037FF361|nr:hypothetical protein [Rubritalea marina]
MAFRIDQQIISGWIDNTTPGVTRGEIIIAGVDRPVRLYIRGNCLRDIAGTRVQFHNPNPQPSREVAENLHAVQRGAIGVCTASQKESSLVKGKAKILNFLQLEWFSLVNAHVVIHTSDFEIEISDHEWTLSKEEEATQQEDNAAALQHFIEIMHTANKAQAQVKEVEGEVDEFEWEKRLRLRDTLEEAAWFLGTQAYSPTIETLEIHETAIESREPIMQHALLVQSRAIDLIGENIEDMSPESDLALATAYVADALDELWPDKAVDLENGYMIAVLKRALDTCHVAIDVCNKLIETNESFEDLRIHVFYLRDLIFDKSVELRTSEKK